ncbi:hypothetical protein IU448_10280 [Nocardia flavorosea]|uniref:hypothetical protein n=1 Tax=Nocardia flavorosea TaxID=53429 RepID=UPI0018963C28|nr:hypothetical protein [Nocardia flavorosea]MBF6349409.1 hypothetical protein [Nocardia flavorosea]
MPDFADFDRRRYRAVDVATGYDGWAPTYEQSVLDDMDRALLSRLNRPRWHQVRRAADLGCGSDQVAAGAGAGWQLAELTESAIDDIWIAAKPRWAHLRGHPFTMAAVWV